MHILTIIGTRPEAVKMAPVIAEIARLKAAGTAVTGYVCSTGQHRDMLAPMFALFDIRPDYELNVMQPDQSPAQTAAAVLQGLDPILAANPPDWLLVQGDTTTVMAAAIAGHYRRVRVGHVEAGLRTYDRANPFPEEMNRVVADHVADYHFAPTPEARRNLLREGIAGDSIFVTGNTGIDALATIAARPGPPAVASLLPPPGRKLLLVTAHRRENHGGPLESICAALRALAARPDVHIVYAVHRNPHVWEPVHRLLGETANITLIPPLDYLPMVHLMQRSYLILTDSGGIQEEAPTLGVPVLVLRATTERPEAVEAGAVRLVGADYATIKSAAAALLDDPSLHRAMAGASNPYGDGHAARRIAALLVNDGRYPAGLAAWQP